MLLPPPSTHAILRRAAAVVSPSCVWQRGTVLRLRCTVRYSTGRPSAHTDCCGVTINNHLKWPPPPPSCRAVPESNATPTTPSRHCNAPHAQTATCANVSLRALIQCCHRARRNAANSAGVGLVAHRIAYIRFTAPHHTRRHQSAPGGWRRQGRHAVGW